MTIVKQPTKKPDEAKLASFTQAAPPAVLPAANVPQPVRAGKPRTKEKAAPNEKVVFTIQVTQADLDAIDEGAAQLRMTRASLVRHAIFELLKKHQA